MSTKLKFPLTLVLSLSLLFISTLRAQETDTTKPKHSYLKFSANYLSNSVYYGRKDSLAVPYLTASLAYHHKSGLYAEASSSYLISKDQSQIDAASVTAGYQFHSSNEKLYGDIYVSKYFNNSSSYSVRSEVNGTAGTYFSYETAPVSISAGADISFSTKTDVGVNLGISHLFEFGDNYNWSVSPTALVNAGTQNFYESYYTQRKFSSKRKRRSGGTSQVSVSIIKKDFAVLDYEISSPLYYDATKWGLYFTPTYSIPVNPVKFSINSGATYKTETLNNSFYIEVGAYVKF